MVRLLCCLTSTEAGWPIRDGDRVGKRARVIGSTAETARKRPERPWTAARTMEVLRRCPLAIAQRLVHCAIALSTAVLDRVTETMSVAPLLTNNLDNSKQKMSNLLSPAPPPYSWSLLGKSEGPAPPPSSKISWSFDLAWYPEWYGANEALNVLRSCQADRATNLFFFYSTPSVDYAGLPLLAVPPPPPPQNRIRVSK